MPPVPEARPYATIVPPARLYRVCIGENPVALRPRETMRADEPPTGRWDDSYRTFRMLYASESAEGALRECLQRFVPSNELLARLKEIEADTEDEKFDDLNVVPRSWLESRRLGVIAVLEECVCVDILSAQSLDTYAHTFDQRLTIGELLGSELRVTQQVSRHLYNRSDHFAGIAALSKLGTHFNFAFYEDEESGALRVRLRTASVEPLTYMLAPLVDVVNQLGLVLDLPADVLISHIVPPPPPPSSSSSVEIRE